MRRGFPTFAPSWLDHQRPSTTSLPPNGLPVGHAMSAGPGRSVFDLESSHKVAPAPKLARPIPKAMSAISADVFAVGSARAPPGVHVPQRGPPTLPSHPLALPPIP